MPHEWDDDACCVRCGFNGAEWHWWRFNTYEGMAKQTPMPPCKHAPVKNNFTTEERIDP